MRRKSGRVAFTLIEVLVALTIAGTIVTTARLLLERLGDDAKRLVVYAAESAAEANAERALRELVGRLEIGTDESRRFVGQEHATRFTTWCDVPAGWQERCTVTLAVDTRGRVPTLAASLSTGDVLVFRRAFSTGALRYLGDAARGGTWFRSWGESITAPLAIGVIVDGDTLLLRIGERG